MAALKHLQAEASEGCRLALMHNAAEAQVEISLLGRAALAASRLQSRRPKIGAFLTALLQQPTGQLLPCVQATSRYLLKRRLQSSTKRVLYLLRMQLSLLYSSALQRKTPE